MEFFNLGGVKVLSEVRLAAEGVFISRKKPCTLILYMHEIKNKNILALVYTCKTVSLLNKRVF